MAVAGGGTVRSGGSRVSGPTHVYVGPKQLSPLARAVALNVAVLVVGVTGIIHVTTYLDVSRIPGDFGDFLLLGLPILAAAGWDRHRVCREWMPPLPCRGGIPGAPSHMSLPRWALWTGRLSLGYLVVLFVMLVMSIVGDGPRCVELGAHHFLVRGASTQVVSRAECVAQHAPFYRFWSGLLFVTALGVALNWTVRRKAPLRVTSAESSDGT